MISREEKKPTQPEGEVKDELLDQVAGGSIMPPPPEWVNPNTESEASGLLMMDERPN